MYTRLIEAMATRIQLILPCISLACLVVCCIFTIMASVEALNPEFFSSTILNVNKFYVTEITPPSWCYNTLLVLIFILNLTCHIYVISVYFLKKKILFDYPSIIHDKLFLGIILINIFHIIWLLLYIKAQLWWCVFFASTMTILLVTTLIFGMNNLGEFVEVNQNEIGINRHIILTMIIVYNGLALYMVWVYLMIILNCVMTLIYNHGWDSHDTSCMGLVLLLVGLVFFSLLEYYNLNVWCAWILSPYLAIVFIFSSILSAHIKMIQYQIATLLIAVIICLVKILYIKQKTPKSRYFRSFSNYNMYTNLAGKRNVLETTL